MLLFEEKSLKTRRWTPVPFDPTSFFGEERVVDSSAPQRELFSPSLMDADASRAYNHSISIHFEGRLDVDAIYSSLLNLIERHEALRGYFSPDGSKFRIRRRLAFSMPVLELSGEEPYADFVRSELDHVFDLVRGPLFRAALLRRGAEHWTLIFTCHHIIVDGWSLKIILDDLPKLYNALKNAEGPGELEPACSFTDYLASTTRLEKEKAHAVRNFWKQEFLHGVPALDLPLDHARPVFRTYRSKREDYRLGDGIFERLKEVGAKGGTSAFITLLSAFALYLHRISGQEELVVGVPAAGQIKGGKSQLLGHDARLLPIRTRLEPGDTFKTFSARVMETFLSAYEHQWICVPELMQELQVRRDPSRAPIAPVMFNFDPGMKAEKFRFQGLRAHHFFNHRNFETFELSINAVVEEDGLVLETAFNTDLFDEKRMHERLQQFERLVSEIGASPETGVLEYPVTTEAQVAAMDLALNSTVMNFERELCADQLIERTVSLLPENIAVEFRESSLSYREIWEQSGRVAYRLMQLGLGQNPLVGVLLERSEKLIPVLLGIWRAGGAFVPLDPNFPQERLRYIVEHSGIELILTSEALQGTLRIEGLRYEIADELLLSQAAPRSLPSRSPENLAYVIYTSGSTGQPKGVKVPHRALVNFLTSMMKAPGMEEEDRLLAVTTLSFDIAELELWLPLVCGARTVIADRTTAMDGQALIDMIKKKQINFLQATPATWRLLMFSDWAGKADLTALCGGEALPRELAAQILARVGKLWNMYGPTETTVWSTMDRVDSGAVTIGKPIGNTQAYILDAQNQWVPQGSVGELWLGGDGVTQGYFGRDDLTEERFVPNRFTGRGLIYKTGDLVRLRLDGRIEYVGRNDHQVKVRGYRIELGEVQAALARHPAISQCVVAAKEKSPGDANLIAYYCVKPGKSVQVPELRQAMKAVLPDYMLPSYYMELGQLPLTPNGKINLKALPAPMVQATQQREDFHEPQSENEHYLARLWSELLGGVRVSRQDRFLELGGSSLLAVRAIQRVEKERGFRIGAKLIILNTLEQIAAEMSGAKTSDLRPTATAKSSGQPLFFGPADRRKFGTFYPSLEGSAPFGVLLCPALGQEYMRTHWLLRNLASSLNRRGAPVLRFDFYGQGDSAGATEEVRLEDLFQSIQDGVSELRARSGVRKIKIVALRGSSLLLEQIRSSLGAGVEVLLVEPVYCGREYLENLRGMQKRRWDAYPFKKSLTQTERSEEILGGMVSRELLGAFEALTAPAGSTAHLTSNVDPGWSDFTRIEEIWFSPELSREIEERLFAPGGTP